MSDGMSDASAEGELYNFVWRAVCDLREAIRPGRGQLDHALVGRVNELISDLGWRFDLAPYAKPNLSDLPITPEKAERIWRAAAQLRRALRRVMVGHRGWSPVIDCEVGYVLSGTGYRLAQFEKRWLDNMREP